MTSKPFFASLWEAICCTEISQKLKLISELEIENLEDMESPVECLREPSYAAFCTIVQGSQVPKRKHLDSQKGRIALLHALAHIEYSAIDIALDHAYRFRHMPLAYYRDWVLTAKEEARHFILLQELLGELDSYYGALPVHSGLFMAAYRSQDSLAKRMAALPRYMEANGLDATPQIIAKLEPYQDKFSLKIIQALQIILEDEIIHVQRGDLWFRYALTREGHLLSDYQKLVSQAVPGAKLARKDFNREARLKAGFSIEELQMLASNQ
ncbi:MAG: ferritin-like domain-containing protein [Leptospiraceae bacterium]|nr:ferritin-like domain-containing protein [Leptospiraceae bacterium]MDW8306533.1 ferritin-like domain-containing protein [Leptospiraceae bacterium]